MFIYFVKKKIALNKNQNQWPQSKPILPIIVEIITRLQNKDSISIFDKNPNIYNQNDDQNNNHNDNHNDDNKKVDSNESHFENITKHDVNGEDDQNADEKEEEIILNNITKCGVDQDISKGNNDQKVVDQTKQTSIQDNNDQNKQTILKDQKNVDHSDDSYDSDDVFGVKHLRSKANQMVNNTCDSEDEDEDEMYHKIIPKTVCSTDYDPEVESRFK